MTMYGLPEHSYVCGVSDKPLLYQTVGETLDAAVRRWPEGEAIVVRHQCKGLTYRQLGAEVDRLARLAYLDNT